jgi:hypothetical protein
VSPNHDSCSYINNATQLVLLLSCSLPALLHCTLLLQDEQCSADVLDPWRFSVMSYNILADKYVSWIRTAPSIGT